MNYLLVVLTVAALIFGGVSLLGAIFGKKNRGRRILYAAGSVLVLVVSVVALTFVVEGDAKSAGYADLADQHAAKAAGFTDPALWSEHKTEVDTAKAETDALRSEALKPFVAYVTEIVEALPPRFEDHGPRIAMESLMEPMPADVLAYAKFWWVADRIEGDCKYLGQRSNIEMLDPDNGVHSWSGIASSSEEHPNYADYAAVNDRVDDVVEKHGEEAVCPVLHQLLGPNGSLMSEAVAINDLLDPEGLDRWRVKPEDGVLWSSRDYCDREYFLEPPKQQDAHDYICSEAKEQGF